MVKKQVRDSSPKQQSQAKRFELTQNSSPPDTRSDTSTADVEAALSNVRKCHAIGLKIDKACSGDHAPSGMVKQLAALHRIPEGNVRRYRQFAQTYSTEALDKHFTDCRRAGFALEMTHLLTLLSVPNANIRATLARLTIKDKLSVGELRKLKLQMLGTSPTAHGRKPQLLKLTDKRKVHQAVQLELRKWNRWLSLLLTEANAIDKPLREQLSKLKTLVSDIQTSKNR